MYDRTELPKWLKPGAAAFMLAFDDNITPVDVTIGEITNAGFYVQRKNWRSFTGWACLGTRIFGSFADASFYAISHIFSAAGCATVYFVGINSAMLLSCQVIGVTPPHEPNSLLDTGCGSMNLEFPDRCSRMFCTFSAENFGKSLFPSLQSVCDRLLFPGRKVRYYLDHHCHCGKIVVSEAGADTIAITVRNEENQSVTFYGDALGEMLFL